MTITVTFNPPLPSDSPSTFNTKAFTLLGDLNDWSTEANALAAGINVDEAALDAAVLAASGSASSASSSAGSATTSAGTATTQAGIATTKAGEANASAIAAAAAAASVNLGNVDINGGTIDGTVIGGSSAAAGSFTAVSASGYVSLSGGMQSSGTNQIISGGSLKFLDAGNTSAPYIDGATTGSIKVRTNAGAEVAAFSSTGLSVTGAVSASGNISGDSNLLLNNGAPAYFYNPGTSAWWRLKHGASGAFSINYNGAGTDAMSLDASGNLGLGVTPSAWASSSPSLQLGFYAAVSCNNNLGSSEFTSNAYRSSGTTWNYIVTNAAEKYTQFNGAHSWYTAPSGTAGNPISFTQAMTLDASGNLIQTVNSTAPTLTVNKTLAFELTSDTQLKIKVRGSDGVTRSATLALA